jgi:hypothetical protein
LARDAKAQVAAGLRLKRLTLSSVDALARVGIRPTVLKGYGLAVRLYPEQPLARAATDVDVLVAPGELERAAEALRTLGLHRHEDRSLHDVFEEHHHLSYTGPAGLVEVHFRLFTGFGGGLFDDGPLRARARPFVLDGRSVLILSPEDEFLYLATHAANHTFLRLGWLVDLARFLDADPTLDWNVMAQRARRAGFHHAVSAALGALRGAFGVALPPAALRHFPTESWRARAEAVLFSPTQLATATLATQPMAAFALRLYLVDSLAAGIRHLLGGASRYVRREGNRADVG